MKVILIKKWDKYNVDEIIDVKDGFAKNFLIKNGFALPYNEKTSFILNKKIEQKNQNHLAKREEALKIKKEIEDLKLVFYLKTTNNVIHGSISTKKVINALKEKGIYLDKYCFPHIAIASIGTTYEIIKLYDDIEAKLIVEVRSEN